MLCIIAVLGVALGAVFWSMTIPMQWRISVAYGLELQDEYGSQISSIDWGTLSRHGIVTKSFILQSRANKPQNVTMNMPSNSSEYGFSSTFPDHCCLAKEGESGDSVAFSITLTDIDMTADGPYSGELKFDVVSDFPSANEVKFAEASREVSYRYATATYLAFEYDWFNKTPAVYQIGETVGYGFVTKMIYPEGNLVAFQYSLYVEDESGLVVKTLADKRTVSCNLTYGQTITFSHADGSLPVFSLPTSGTYHMNITYELCDWLPQKYTLTIQYATSGGYTSPSAGSYQYTKGSVVSVIAYASSGYVFDYWLYDGIQSSQNPIIVTINANQILKAHWKVIQHSLSIQYGNVGGTTNPSAGTYQYNEGSNVQVTAYANSGYAFDYWLLDGATRTENPITVTMNTAHTLKAYWKEVITLSWVCSYEMNFGSDYTTKLAFRNVQVLNGAEPNDPAQISYEVDVLNDFPTNWLTELKLTVRIYADPAHTILVSQPYYGYWHNIDDINKGWSWTTVNPPLTFTTPNPSTSTTYYLVITFEAHKNA